MAKRPIIPPQYRVAAEQLKLSPALVSGNHVFLTGVTGSGADGQMPDDPAVQFRNVFDKIGLVLHHADLTFGAIVALTSFHVGIHDHFDLFAEVRAEYVQEPYPAWSAVEVAGLRRKGAIVEIRVIASIEHGD
ncbi:MAG: RidA family protein [Marinosulfonomonas sp.]|nr:RidA family protein [Marinosulfonomonas sp.]